MSTVTRRRCRWSLSREASNHSSSSSEDDSSNSYLYLVVNGTRARSKRTKSTYDHLTGIQRRDDNKVMFTMASGKKVVMQGDEMDSESLCLEFDLQTFTLDDLETQVQPLLSSTPRDKTKHTYRKRLRDQRGINIELSCKGIVEVPIENIEQGNPMLMLIKSTPSRVEAYKAAIVSNPKIHLPILPVMTLEDDWDEDKASTSKYMLLGGCNLLAAIVDLVGDNKFAHLKKCAVRVHGALGMAEALHVGALFQQEQGLLIDDVPTLQARVAVCRRLLYSLHNLDEDSDEPPTRVQDSWRKQAAAALGCLSSNPKDRKKLEVTFQIALYSRRCYTKLERLFTLYEEKKGKALKQTVFVNLQGLKENDKYALLTKVVNGEMEFDEMKAAAKHLKGLHCVQAEFQLLANRKTWQDCCRDFPEYTSDSALEQFIGMNFKTAIPRDFFNYVQEATQARTGSLNTSSGLRESPVRLTIIEVESTAAINKTSRDLKDGSANVVLISDSIAMAFKWQQELERQGFLMCGEGVIVGDVSARYMIAATTEDQVHQISKLLPETDVFRSILSVFSNVQDRVALAVKDYDTVQDEAEELGRVPTRLTVSASSAASEPSSSEYDFSEPESTD